MLFSWDMRLFNVVYVEMCQFGMIARTRLNVTNNFVIFVLGSLPRISNDQMYSRQRDWRLSASCGGAKGPRYHGTVVSWGSRWALNCASIMPRGTSLSDIRSTIFWSGSLQAYLIFFHVYSYVYISIYIIYVYNIYRVFKVNWYKRKHDSTNLFWKHFVNTNHVWNALYNV